MTLLTARALTLRIGDRPLCTGLDFALERGQFWALLGANGIGKTTLLHALAGLRGAEGGIVAMEGRDVREWPGRTLARQRGVLFQDSQDTFPGTVFETALAGCHPHLPFWALEGAREFESAVRALQAAELGGMGARRIDTLSGGERRRLAIAALLVQDPLLWLLDEPANHLDLRHQVGMLAHIVSRVRERNGALIMALHDVNMALRHCTHAALMIDAATILCGSMQEILNAENLERMYRCPVRRIVNGDGREFYFPD
ncbi:MAG: ABC transporter ATP-binding protein [Gammaproteobacteria bacterium]|nr:ABC transporter ATP-binding protein [Gammaproteobacteria bacterium]